MKVLIADPAKCSGCMACVLECAFAHEKAYSVFHARIRNWKKVSEGVYVPVVCEQCLNPPCMAVCPAECIAYDYKLHVVTVDREKCTGCGLCVEECPFGAIWLDSLDHKAIKCDLCGGDPVCVKVCKPGALRYEEVNKSTSIKKFKTINEKLRIFQENSVIKRSE